MMRGSCILKRFVFIGGFALAMQLPSYGQRVPEAEFFSVANGLSQSQVNCVFQDSFGYLWIGTQDGLNRYDGISFQHYYYAAYDSSSLSSNYVRQMSEDTSGNLWIATENGLNRYNRLQGNFTRLRMDRSRSAAFGNDQIYGILADARGTVWAKSSEKLFGFKPANLRVRDYQHFNNPFNSVSWVENYPLYRDSQGILWLGTKDGLNSFQEESGKFTLYSSNPSQEGSISDNLVKAIYEDKSGRLWVGTNFGLNLLDRSSGKFTYYFPAGQHLRNDRNTINAITEDRNGNLWLGTSQGVAVYDPVNNRFSGIMKVAADNQLLEFTSITSLLFDNADILWVGALEGLYKIDTKPKKFKLYKNQQVNGSRFTSDLFASVMQDRSGKLLLGTWEHGLNVFERSTGVIRAYTKAGTDPALRISDDHVFSILETQDGKVLLGTQNGLDLKMPGQVQFRPLCAQYPKIKCNSFSNTRIYRMMEDRSGNIWIGTAKGLHCINKLSGELINIYQVKYQDQVFDLRFVYSLEEDSLGRIWCGGNSGIFMYDPVGKLYTHYGHSENQADSSLTTNSVFCMRFDHTGTLWVGTESGLNRLNTQTGRFRYYTTREGMPNNLVYSIEEDDRGMIWVSTNRGLAQLNPQTDQITSFDLSDGIQSYEYNINCSWKGQGGELFFGGISGLNAFFSDSINLNMALPPVHITSVELYEDGLVNRTYYGSAKEITIPWSVRSFVVNYASLDFTYPVRNKYFYKLVEEGDEGVWIDSKGRTSASFINLARGIYEFHVIGSNSDNVWNETGASLRIRIKGPFWQSKFAIGLYILLFSGIIVWIIQWNISKRRKANRELNERRISSLRIEKQKEELTIKNRNITDSLIYAKRIQEALMPSAKLFDRLLPQSFILYRPKDIVSGDFYWIVEKNGLIGIAAVDCTGHGVPGAFMSIIGFELFRKIANSDDLKDPAHIIKTINARFGEIFEGVDHENLRDGMDMAFCTIDKANRKLTFAGAMNPLYLIRDNKVMEIKGDRYSVGLDELSNMEKTFTNTMYDLEADDILYIFSDGFADQFGGEDGKKFKYRRFRFLLLNIHNMPLEQQKSSLEEAFDAWRGKYDQVDDLLVMGFRPLKNSL